MHQYNLFLIIFYCNNYMSQSSSLNPYNSIQLTVQFKVVLRLENLLGSPFFTCSTANYSSYNLALNGVNSANCPTTNGFKLWMFNISRFEATSLYIPLSVSRSVAVNSSTVDYLNLCCFANGYKLNWAIATVYLQPYLPINYDLAEKSPELVNYPLYYNIAPCPCNVTEQQCDINCCCDQECTPADIKLFDCIVGVYGGNIVPTNDYSNNCDSLNQEGLAKPFLCISKENNALLGLFFPPATELPSPPTYSPGLKDDIYVGDNTLGTDYRMGLAIATTLKVNGVWQNIAGPNYVLSLPQDSHSCSSNSPLLYLHSFSDICPFQISGKANICSSSSRLSATMFLQQLTWPNATGPAVLTRRRSSPPNPAPTTVTYLCASTAYAERYIGTGAPAKPGQFTQSFFATSVRRTMARPPRCVWNPAAEPRKPVYINATNSCAFSVVEVLYVFKWNGSLITSVNVEIVLANVSLISSYIKQNFTVAYKHIDIQDNQTDTLYTAIGYKLRSPIITGRVDLNASDFNVDTNVYAQSALWNPDITGLCSSSTYSSNILFGVDSLQQCFVQINKASFSNCTMLRRKMLDGLNQLMPSDVIALISNPSNNDTSHWLSLFRQNISYIFENDVNMTSLNETSHSNLTQLDGVCGNVPSGISLVLLFSTIGKTNGADFNVIVGAKIYYELSTWRVMCTGANSLACTSSNMSYTQQFLVSSSARFSFVDQLTPKLTRYEEKTSELERICSEDKCWSRLFYPFSEYNLGNPQQYKVAAALIFALMICMIFFASFFFSNLVPSNLHKAYGR